MYIWIGAKLPEEFEAYIRKVCLPLGEMLNLDVSGYSLPQHISLKISFPAEEQYEQILDFLEDRLSQERVFYVNPRTPQRQKNILWIPFRTNAPLRHYHNMLDRELKERFGVEQHEFDKAFVYHSTLFFGEEEPLAQAENILRNLPLPGQLTIDTILLGISETGKSGDYHVVREIPLKRRNPAT